MGGGPGRGGSRRVNGSNGGWIMRTCQTEQERRRKKGREFEDTSFHPVPLLLSRGDNNPGIAEFPATSIEKKKNGEIYFSKKS